MVKWNLTSVEVKKILLSFLYLTSDNQLPQGESGELTRHISLNRLNINEYFLVKDNGKDGGVEYFIDVEKIIRESGDTNKVYLKYNINF